MRTGTGLLDFSRIYKDRFFDVGIAEEHAITFSCGMASKGMIPVFAVYSTFLQRGYDQLLHDVCLQNLDVLFCLDRAGLSPQDGATHHGVFDIAMLRCLPNLTVMQPKDEDELADMMHTAFVRGGPHVIRYPRGSAPGAKEKDVPALLEIGKAEVLAEGDGEVCIWSLGSMLPVAEALCKQLAAETGTHATLVNARFVKPLDEALLAGQAKRAKLFVTLEDHALAGGFGSAVLEALAAKNLCVPVERFGWEDRFVPHGTSVGDLRSRFGLDAESVIKKVRERLAAL